MWTVIRHLMMQDLREGVVSWWTVIVEGCFIGIENDVWCWFTSKIRGQRNWRWRMRPQSDSAKKQKFKQNRGGGGRTAVRWRGGGVLQLYGVGWEGEVGGQSFYLGNCGIPVVEYSTVKASLFSGSYLVSWERGLWKSSFESLRLFLGSWLKFCSYLISHIFSHIFEMFHMKRKRSACNFACFCFLSSAPPP